MRGRVNAMRIAFYAPLKAPDHPLPSGDRRVAQLFFRALEEAGHAPFLASRLRSYDGAGDLGRQARLKGVGASLARALESRWRRRPREAPQLWFTYHLYHKAPDHLGPFLAEAFAIPYVVAEASFAGKRAGGPWAIGHEAAEHAIRRADLVIALNSADREGVLPLLKEGARLVSLKPFLDPALFYRKTDQEGGEARLITVAMMREGDKLRSYRLLGEALETLLDLPWSLEVVGDGGARAQVEKALAPLAARVRWSGVLESQALASRLAASDLFVWPAINEAFGMALLEAAASGLPVVAGDFGGVRDIVASGLSGLLVPPANAKAFASAVRGLLLDRARRERMGREAFSRVRAEHDCIRASRRLEEAFAPFARATDSLKGIPARRAAGGARDRKALSG